MKSYVIGPKSYCIVQLNFTRISVQTYLNTWADLHMVLLGGGMCIVQVNFLGVLQQVYCIKTDKLHEILSESAKVVLFK